MKYLEKYGITAEKRIHKGWEEFQRLKEKTNEDYWKKLAK
jgi:hypothetical protein